MHRSAMNWRRDRSGGGGKGSHNRETLQTTGFYVGRIVIVPREFAPMSHAPAGLLLTMAIRMRFLRHHGIYRSDVVHSKTKPWRNRAASRRSVPSPGKRTRREDHALLIVRDEFRPAIPRSGWSPPEPVSASPARTDYHALLKCTPKTGTFYFARKRNFLFCLDTPHFDGRRGVNSL